MTWVVFGQTLGHEFVNYDDELYVADSPEIIGGLSLKGIVWAFTHNVNVNWTPLTVISHMLDCQFYGSNAGGHLLTNVVLHMASGILLFLALKKMTGALWRSAFVAALFAIHPLRAESVAWIAERRDVLSGLFFMLTLGAYNSYVRHGCSAGRYLMVALMLALALMSKPMVVTLPFVLLLLDYWPLKRFAQPGDRRTILWRLILEKLPLLALCIAVGVVTLFAQKEIVGLSLPFLLRIGNALLSYVAYMGQMVYPAGLAVYYPFPGNSLAPWRMFAAFVLLLAISVVAVVSRRKQPWFLVGWSWYLGMLVPVIGLVQPGLRAHADRYTYLPQIGLYVLLAWAAADFCAGWRHRRLVLGGCAMLALSALIYCARIQVSYWRNSELLWTHTLACTSDNAEADYNLGNALLDQGRLDEAIARYQMALQINPNAADVLNNFGNALIRRNSVDEAIAQYQKALQINPDYARARLNLGNALFEKGNLDEAISHYQKALHNNPGYERARVGLGNALLKKGRVSEAIIQYKTALQINPGSAEVQNNLAWVLATASQAALRNGHLAVELARQANQLTGGKNPIILRTLAAACAEDGQFGDARQSAKKAMAHAAAAGQTNLVAELNSELRLYTAGLPFHEDSN